jgi:hypothetical protein
MADERPGDHARGKTAPTDAQLDAAIEAARDPADDADGAEPDGAIKRETVVIVPGTGRKPEERT